jgi:TPR repeat protein
MRCISKVLACMAVLLFYSLLSTYHSLGAADADATTPDYQALMKAAFNGDAPALAQLQAAALSGNAAAQNDLGYYYYLENQYTNAFYWFQKAAVAGEPQAEGRLGDCFSYGQGVGQNDAAAAYCYRKAAQNGDVHGEYKLGQIYEQGRGVNQDYLQAASCYRKAADKGYPDAAAALSHLYANGLGVTADQQKAQYWANRAQQLQNGGLAPGSAMPEGTVAQINGQWISEDQFAEPLTQAQRFLFFLKLRNLTLLEQAGEQAGIPLGDEEIDGEYQLVVDQFARQNPAIPANRLEAALNKDIQKKYNESSAAFRIDLAIDAYEVVLSNGQIPDVTEDQIQEVYNVKYGPKIEVQDIVVSNLDDAAAVSRLIMDEHADVGKIFELYSINKLTSANHGLEFIPLDDASLPQRFRDVAGELNYGTLSAPLPLDNEYHLLWLIRRIPAASMPLPLVYDQIKRQAEVALQLQWGQNELKRLVAAANIQIFDPVLQKEYQLFYPGYSLNGEAATVATTNYSALEQAAVNGDSQSLAGLQAGANSGNANAQFYLGAYYESKNDNADAFNWSQKAAQQGNANAESCLGYLYMQGQGTSRDYTQALSWFQKAAVQGNADACQSLSYMYGQGLGVAVDPQKAAYWANRAQQLQNN